LDYKGRFRTIWPYNPRQRINWSADCQLDRLAYPAEHFHECIDVELAVFLFTTSDTRGRETIRISAASACFSDVLNPDRQLFRQLRFSRRVSLICLRDAACSVGLVRRKAQFQEEVRSWLCHMADFGVDLHFVPFLALTTAR